jgi:hypothetical protein
VGSHERRGVEKESRIYVLIIVKIGLKKFPPAKKPLPNSPAKKANGGTW